MKMSNKVYDVLKWVVITVLPGLGLLYSSLSAIWGLPYGDAVAATLDAVTLFIGTCIGISSVRYRKTEQKNGL